MTIIPPTADSLSEIDSGPALPARVGGLMGNLTENKKETLVTEYSSALGVLGLGCSSLGVLSRTQGFKNQVRSGRTDACGWPGQTAKDQREPSPRTLASGAGQGLLSSWSSGSILFSLPEGPSPLWAL